LELAIAFAVAKLKAIKLTSDVALTLKTNDSGSPQETISLAAGVPLDWYYGCGLAVPFAGNVTKIYATEGGIDAGTLSGWLVVDPT
jgi:hypothetical protein